MVRKRQAIVIDLDSTLLDSSHRKWNSYDLIKDDVIKKDLKNLCRVYSTFGYEIIILTARENDNYLGQSIRDLTIENLRLNGMYLSIDYGQILVKEISYEFDNETHYDYKSRIIKQLMETYRIELFIDDNEETIEEIKKLGITCLHCKYKKLYE